ncbi:MAG TPA: toll/interleukin-1 receptor domain-containing protein [Polyangia bacterium]|nr:toll/interleukin-1 receptor domain-containing protein [Polyangia bacterium]
MKIFVSWSGERSQALALALRDWLPLVLHYAEPWLSTLDIQSGDRWSIEIAKGLQESKFGVICVTRDNLEAPWLLFESGALAKSMEDGRVIPLRLDLDASDISGPLAQFQSEKTDSDGIRRLVSSLNKVATAPVSEDRLTQLFEAMWGNLEKKIAAFPASGTPQKRPRPQSEILEELVSGVRNVEIRVRDIAEDDPGMRRRFRRRHDPGLIMHLAHRMGDGPEDPIQLLIVASLFKDDLPWLYELALDAYRSSKEGNRTLAKRSYLRFREALEMLKRGPLLEMLGMDGKMMHMALMESMDFLPQLTFDSDELQPPTLRRRRSKTAGPEG